MKRLATVGIVLCLGLAGGSVTAAAEGSEREFRVGLVVNGDLNDQFNRLIVLGLERAEDRLNVETSVARTPFGADATPYLTTFAEKNYDLVIAFGFTMAGAVDTVSNHFPNVHFVLLDGIVDRPNVESVLFKEQESGALAGVIAEMLEVTGRAPKNHNVISAIGVKSGAPPGILFPPVEHYLAGYRWGARLVDSSVTVLIDYAHNFFGPECGVIAQSEIAAGADIVFPVAGDCSLSAYQAASQAGVYSIGVDISQKSADPSVIVSAVKKYDWATFDVIKAAVDGEFRSGIVTLGLTDRATGYTVDNFPDEKLPPDIRKKLADVQRGIKSGSLVPPTTL